MNCNIGSANPKSSNCTFNCGNCNCTCDPPPNPDDHGPGGGHNDPGDPGDNTGDPPPDCVNIYHPIHNDCQVCCSTCPTSPTWRDIKNGRTYTAHCFRLTSAGFERGWLKGCAYEWSSPYDGE